MQRKSTKNTRGANTRERAFQVWIKERRCGYCGAEGPSICDHSKGSTFRHNKKLIGHWLVTPKCVKCDAIKTLGNRKWHNEQTGKTESECWLGIILEYPGHIPEDIIYAIKDWGK